MNCTRTLKQKVRAWHFLAPNRRLGYSDRRRVFAGKTLTVTGRPIPCTWGLHASVRLYDALRYASGPILCRVVVGGEVAHGGDKVAGQTRTVLSMLDARPALRAFLQEHGFIREGRTAYTGYGDCSVEYQTRMAIEHRIDETLQKLFPNDAERIFTNSEYRAAHAQQKQLWSDALEGVVRRFAAKAGKKLHA